MDVLFVLPAFLAAAILIGQAAYSAVRIYRSTEAAGHAGSVEATMPFARWCGSAALPSNLRKVK